ncbi:hypothetical protein [Actinomyces oris]|uniref:hypothetical protein n=2 Tax=Actinomyces TaxID=1654 RepID=UPI001C4BA0F3|nr:hypothetical protein [Actinomyces oris]
MDIDYSTVNQIRLRYDQVGRICYLPCIKFFAKTPTLNASASSTGSHHITIARRHENSILGAAILVGRLLHGISEYEVDFNEARLWVPKLLDWLVESMQKHEFESNIDPTRLQLSIALQLPTEIHKKIVAQPGSKLLSNLTQSYIRSLSTFPLFVAIPCCEDESNSTTTTRYRKTVCNTVETITLTRHDRLKGGDNSHRKIWQMSNLFTGTEYMLALPQFGLEDEGTHARIICPKGMVVDSIAIFSGENNFPIYRSSIENNPSKYWSTHYGYVKHDDKLRQKSGKGSLINLNETTPKLEVLYNRRNVDLRDCGLPATWPVGSEAMSASGDKGASTSWQVRLSMSSRRSRFLVPTLGLLICSIYALTVNILKAQESDHGISLSSVSTLGLPLLLGFLVVGEEHLVLSQALFRVRKAVATATIMFVITACTLAVAGRNHYSIVLYIAAMLFGLNAVFHTFIQIVRIGYFRADAFEEARMRLADNYHELIDDELAKIDETEPDPSKRIKLKKRVIRRAKWGTFDAAIFNGKNRTYILKDIHSEILPRWALKLYPTTRRKLLLELLFLLALVKATAITYPFVIQFLGIVGKALWPIVRQVLSWLSLI